MLQDLLGIFLRQDNLLNLEEGSADVDLMNFEDLRSIAMMMNSLCSH